MRPIDIQKYAEELYDHIAGFNLRPDGIDFRYDDPFKVYLDSLTDPAIKSSSTAGFTTDLIWDLDTKSVNFEEFGCENLNIFD